VTNERLKLPENVESIDLWFVDLLGTHRSLTVSKKVFIKGLEEGYIPKLDGSSVYGFANVEFSDMKLQPDISTFRVVEDKAIVYCNVLDASGKPLIYDPRSIAFSVESKVSDEGFQSVWGPEVEFFIFERVSISYQQPWLQHVEISSPELTPRNSRHYRADKSLYCMASPVDSVLDFRYNLVKELKKYGINVECHHHEVARGGQVEVNVEMTNLVGAGDSVIKLKFVSKNLAYKMNLQATFMPKPLYGENGSGMHIHQSLWRNGENLFYDPNDEYAGLSQLARYYIGGLLEHGKALSAIVAPTVNSYKRLVPGYEAPVYLVWSVGNRTAAVRVPVYGGNNSKRVEFRPPDPSANPYLALVAILAAGIDGIKKSIDPGDPVDENVYLMSEAKKRSLGIKELPRDLKEALDELRSDMEFLKGFIPKEVLEKYIELKEEEWRKVSYTVSPIEYIYYLNI